MSALRITQSSPPSRAAATHPADTPGVRFWDRMAPRYAASAIADKAGYERTLARVGALLATDSSPAMIAVARQRWRAQPSAQLSFAVADAQAALQEKAGGYHGVLAFNMLHLVDDLDAVLSAAARALAPGGLLISKTPCVREMNLLVARIAVPLARMLGAAPRVQVFDEAQLLACMRANGLETAIVERHGTGRKDVRAFVVARKA